MMMLKQALKQPKKASIFGYTHPYLATVDSGIRQYLLKISNISVNRNICKNYFISVSYKYFATLYPYLATLGKTVYSWLHPSIVGYTLSISGYTLIHILLRLIHIWLHFYSVSHCFYNKKYYVP